MMTNLERVQAYYDDPALSQSKIKELLGYGKPSAAAMTLGSLVDSIVTMPEHVDDLYAFGEVPDKSSATFKMVEYMVNNDMDIAYDEDILAVHELFNHQSNWKAETKIAKFRANEYLFDFILNTKGKTVVSIEEKMQADNIANQLLEHIPEGSMFQVDIYNTMFGVKCKGLIDFITPDDVIYDIKVLSSPVKDIKYMLRKMRTDMQLSFYKELAGVKHNPKVLIYSTSDNEVVTYEMTDLDLSIGKFGFDKPGVLSVDGESYAYDTTTYGWYQGIHAYLGQPIIKQQPTLWM